MSLIEPINRRVQPPNKRGLQYITFLISESKHTLWVLKSTVTAITHCDCSFEHSTRSKHKIQITDKTLLVSFHSLGLLFWECGTLIVFSMIIEMISNRCRIIEYPSRH